MMSSTALVLAPRFPEFDRESGSRRVFDLVTMLADAGWSVTVGAEHPDRGERYGTLLARRGVEVHTPLGGSVEPMLAERRFDLAIVAFWFLAERYLPALRRLSPPTRVVVDSIDVHFVRNARARLGRGDGSGPGPLDQAFGDEFARELTVYAAADAVLTVSAKEAELVNDLSAIRGLAHVVPDCEEIDLSPIPLEERRGVLFVGNFRHPPNVEAVEYLCREVVPRLDASLLADHRIRIVGNALDEAVARIGDVGPHVELVGWVPSVLPYLASARVCVTPVLHGAGTKRKLIQSLMAGTPAVSTRVGVEGLDARGGEHLLVADDSEEFAAAIERLLRDDAQWQRLSRQGRELARSRHGRREIERRFLAVVESVLANEPRAGAAALSSYLDRPSYWEYERLVARVREVVAAAVPRGATVLVASKGDHALVRFSGSRGWHFPQTSNGTYAGEYPADDVSAITHLEELRTKGADYLVLPRTAFWWLGHYTGLRGHLDRAYARIWEDESSIVYRLEEAEPRRTDTRAEESPSSTAPFDRGLIERLRPQVRGGGARCTIASARRGKVLALGIYLADQPNSADDVVSVLAETTGWEVTQRWIGVGGEHASERVAAVTARIVDTFVPKYRLLNELLAGETLDAYDFIVALDDDIVLPRHFLDRFLSYQTKLGFAMAQPARTTSSYIDHPIVEQQLGALARRTLFVEIGPVIVVHRSAYDLVFPFDLTSPMGWGYENVWAYKFERRGLTLGIIDAVPVDHSLRKPVENYSWERADRQRRVYLDEHDHLPAEACTRVLSVVPVEER